MLCARTASSVLAVALGLLACSDSSSNTLLGYVPEDTPYLAMSGDPLPDEVAEKFKQMSTKFQSDYGPKIVESYAQTLEGLPNLSPESRQKILDALTRMVSVSFDSMISELDWVLYGRGLSPVVRVELGDPDSWTKLMDELAAEGGAFTSNDSRGDRFWRYNAPGEEAVFLMTIQDSRFFAGISTGGDEKVLLDHLYSEPDDDQADAIAEEVEEIRDRHEMIPFQMLFVDTKRLLTRVAELAPEPATSAECMDIYARIAPRLVAGYTEITGSRLVGSAILELDSNVAGELTQWTTPLRSLDGSDPILSLAFGLNFAKAAESLAELQQKLNAGNNTCDLLSKLASFDPTTLGQALGMLGGSGNPRTAQIAVYSMPANPLAPAEPWSLTTVVGAESPDTLAAMASSLLPTQPLLAKKGTPAQLETPAMLTAMSVPDVWGVLLDDGIAFATGDGSETRLSTLADSEPAESDAVFTASLDWERLAVPLKAQMKTTMDLAAAMSPDPQAAAAMESQLAMLDLYIAFLKRTDFKLAFTDEGIVIEQKAELH